MRKIILFLILATGTLLLPAASTVPPPPAGWKYYVGKDMPAPCPGSKKPPICTDWWYGIVCTCPKSS